jgi:uridylate kinase
MGQERPIFQRILLKLSGEALGPPGGKGLAAEALDGIAVRIRDIAAMGVEVAVVVGGGNFFRGLPASRKGLGRTTGDLIGMLATVMNGLALRDALEQAGQACQLQSAFAIDGMAAPVDSRAARHLLAKGTVVIFAGGTGQPFFTTDTTAALRACQISADAVLKATKVDGVYSADPKSDPEAVRYEHLHYHEALSQRLAIMDSTAFSLCMDNGIPIVVFNFSTPDSLPQVIRGDCTHATIVGELER